LVDSQRDHGITVVGPVQADGSWQARTPGGLTSAQFAIDWEAQQVTCPVGKISRRWQRCTDTWGNDGIVVQFTRADCQGCAQREVCTRAKTAGRQLMVRPQEQHSALQAARAWQETAGFKATYARRAGVEGRLLQANGMIVPQCPIHHRAMKQSQYGGFYCTAKNGEGEYCKEKIG
jgi:transposase